MSMQELLDRLNWFLRLVLGEYAKVIAAFAAWQVGLPVNVSVQIGRAKFHIVEQESAAPGIRRRLVIEELV